METHDPVTHVAESAAPAPARKRASRRRTMMLVLLGTLLMLLGGSGVGAYQGWLDRSSTTQRDAITYFDKGQDLLASGQYDLASANFREALRLEPNFTAAAQLLQVAEQRALAAANVPAAPLPTPLPVADNERLFADAVAALQRGEWEIAAATFDLLTKQVPDFRTDEVKEGLFRARRGAAEAALEAGDLDGALRHLDQALALRPNDASLASKRRVVSAYRTAQRAIRSKNWTVAADQLRTVYLVDPSFLDVKALLAQAHYELAREFAKREIWCQAAQQYRASNEVDPDALIADAATDADARCSLRATAPPPRATRTAEPTEAGGRTTPWVTQTPYPFGTVTATAEISATVPIVVTPTVPPLATWTPVPASPTVATAGGFVNTFVGESINSGCGGQYIVGMTRAPDGAPIADVTILALDEYGNRYVGTSKLDPIGRYNIPIPGQLATYRVMVVRGDQTISPVVTVAHDQRFVQSSDACHIIDWQQR